MGRSSHRQADSGQLRRVTTEVYFYRVSDDTSLGTLRTILSRSRKAGWRVLIRGNSESQLAYLDDELWKGPDGSFLPHAIAGGEFDREQPILLATDDQVPNSAEMLLLVGNSRLEPSELSKFKRASVLISSADDHEIGDARALWKRLKDAGVPLRYWQEVDGSWKQRATANLAKDSED